MQETSPASNSSRGKIYELKMPSLAEIVVIKRNGTDGTHFPLTSNSCVFGRKKECDIRIQLPQVSKEHCKIEINENKEAVLFNLSSANPTQLNGTLFQDPTHLKHGDILTIIDRSFRFEYPRSSLPQKRLSRSQEKETLQILHVQHMQQMDLLHPQNSDYKSSPITDKKFEICSPKRNEKRLQKQYSTAEFNCKTPSVEKANELSPFSKLYELMKHKDGTGNVKENTGDETLLEDVFYSRSRRSAMRRAKSTKVEQSEDSKIQGNHDLVASPIPTFEEKNSEKSPNTQNCDTRQKQECEGTNQSDVNNIEDDEVGKHAHFKANQQSAQHFPETSIQSLDDAEKAKCLNKFNVIDVFTSVENALPKTKPSWESTQKYSSPHSRRSRRSSKSRRTGVEVESLNRRKSSGEMKECPVQVSEQEHESGILVENIYSKANENRELVTETAPNLKDSEDGNSSTVFSSRHLNTSENCNNNIELNKTISNGYSCIEAVDKESMIPANLSQTSEIMANEIPEKTLETKCPANENKKIGTESHEQNVNMKNDMPTFSSYESRVQISAKVNAVSEMNVLCPLNKKSEARKSPQKRRGTELDLLVQSLGKRRRVSFGGHLSPELFDKRLPPNSPLKKGAIPARLSMPFGNSPRAVLKKAAEVRQSVTQGSFERKQYENIVSRQADLDSVPQRQQCISDPHVARSLSSEAEATSTQERHTDSLVSEFKKAASNATSSLRSKTCTRRSSISRKSGTVGTIRSKRRSGASEANLMVVKSWAEVVKQGVPKVQLKSASKQVFKTRKTKKVASKSSKNNSLKTPKRKISGHFSTGHANSPAPIVIGKAHTGILNVTAQVPTVMNNYPLKKHCDLNESFTGLAEMFCSPPNGKEKSFVPETQISEINASEEFEKNSVLDVNISSQKRAYKSSKDVISPALEEVSQIPIHDNLMVSLNERNIMGMEEKNLQQESEPGRQVLEIKRLLKTKKEKSEPLEALSGVKRLLRTPKKTSEPVEALSAVKRLLKTPKQKSEPVEALSGVKRLLRTPKQKSDPVEVLSAVKRLSNRHKEKSEPDEMLSEVKRLLETPEQKSESDETLSGVKRLLRTPKEKSESDETLSGVNRILRTPKQKSDPVEALSAVKRLSNTPKEKSEPDEMLSEVKRLLETPEQKSESDETLSGVNRILRTPKEKSESDETLSGVNRILRTPKQKSDPVEALSAVKRLSNTPKEKSEPDEMLSEVKRLLETPEQKSESDETLSGVKRLLRTPKEKSESDETLSGVNRILRTPKQKSDPVEALSAVKRLSNTPKEKSEPDEMLSEVKRLLETPEQKSESDETLSGVNRILRTPKEKSNPVEGLSAVKRFLKTPKEKSEPIEALSEVKRLLETPEQKSESDEMLSGVKRLLRTPKEKSESDETLSGVNRILRTPKQKSDPVEALSAVKRLSNTPKEKSEPDEMLSEVKGLLETPEQKSESDETLSGVNRISRSPKQKSDPVEAFSAVKRLSNTPKEKSEPDEMLSEVKRLLETPEQKSESDDMLLGVKRLLRTPKQKSEPVEELSAVKRLLKTPKQKSEPIEALSAVKKLLETPEQKSEPVEVFSAIKTLKTPKQTMAPLADDIYTKSRLSTEEVSKDMIGSVTKNKTQIMEDTNINDITEEVKETVKTIEDRRNNQMMSAKERFEPMNNMVGSSQTLKASKSMPTDDYLGLQKFMVEPRESSVIPDIGYTGVKETLDTENDKDKMPESLNFVEENGSYTSSRNKLDSMESVPGSCEANLEMKIEKESHFPVTKSNSSVPNHVGHIACNSFSELKTEFNNKTTRTISLSENYEPDGMSFKNEAETDFVKEAAENSDALKPENPEPLASARTRRKKINDCSSAIDTKMIQRPTKNRSTSANCEQIIESFDSHTELNPSHKSESNFTTIEPTKLSKRGRPKKQYVETNGNIGSDNINYTQELEKSLKEVTVEKQPVNRRKVPTKRKGKTVTSMDLEENGPIQENESDLTAKTRLRSRNVKKSASDVKTFAKGKANDTVSEEESNKRNKRRKMAATESTLITTLNADRHEKQKCTISKICKTEASENNITAVEENLVKKKKVQFLLRESFKASEEKCALSYESNIQREEESQTENICNGIPKVSLEIMQTPVEPSPPRIEKLSRKNLRSRGRGKKSVFSPSVESENNRASDGKDHDVIVSLKENQPRRGRRRKIDQVLLKSIPLENNTSGDSAVSKCPSSPGGCSLPQVQKENFEESEMLPLENVQSHEGRIPPKKVVKENPPRRGRSKQVNETSGIKEADVQGPNMAIRQEDNQSKRTRGKRDTQKSCSLKSQRTVKENPPRQGRRKKTISGDVSINSDSAHIIPIIEETMDGKNACLAKEDQSKVGRRTRNTVVFHKILSVKNDTCPNRGEHSDEQPNEDLKTANNASENFTYNCRKRKAVHEISANSVSSSKKSECIDDDIQQNGKKNSKTVSKQNTTRNKRKRLTPCGMMNDELRINSKKSPLVTDNVGPLENNFGKHQSKKQREETNITSLVSPSLKVSITLSPLSSNENQNGNCKVSVGKRELAKLSGTCNIMTRSLRRKDIIPKEELVHETQNKDLQKTAMVTVINQRRGRRKINKLEAAEEKCSLSGGSDNFPNEQILNNVSNKKVSLMGKAPKVPQIKTMTQNINKNDSSNYDQNKNLKHSSMLVQKSSSERAKRKQINNSETSTIANVVKNVIPENKSTVSKTVHTVQTRGKKKKKEENTTLSAELPKETERRTRASKRIRK
ncbi:proliferation marker protein Ki-67 isoform X2 [Thamnophis elegans]|uniref:proliferation marker protein Ki-67 isoform X2 n=1 Tax=Thamnophis elegans TaxID=35005 RepID=UPI0013766147|nr:proliferation marker protein Ki-67 isoform X2 [Thamnophis elegans]